MIESKTVGIVFLGLSFVACAGWYLLRQRHSKNDLVGECLVSFYQAVERQDFATAFGLAQKAALLGSAEGHYLVGYYYLHGIAVDVDHAVAFEHFHKAAERGYAKAYYGLSVMYNYGEGCEPDAAKAFEWLKRFEREGEMHAEAAYALGDAYARRNDNALAEKYFLKSLELNPTYAKPARELGFLYSSPGALENFVLARKYFEIAAEQGDPEAFMSLGLLFLAGKGGEVDLEKARECFEIMAAEPEYMNQALANLDIVNELEALDEQDPGSGDDTNN